jgi:hypothetical protein
MTSPGEFRMKLPVPIFVIALAAAVAGQNSAPRESELKTFTSPDGSFQFTFPAFLIQCEKRQEGDGYVWVQKECSAYFPTCDESIGVDSKTTTIACIAYPRNKYTDTDAFEAATFSVAEVDPVTDEKSCVSPVLDQIDRKKGTARIGGVSFSSFETGEAGMNQNVGAEVYRTFHAKKCYQLTIAIAEANAQVFDPPARDFSKQDWNEVNGELSQARDSFRFLK